MESKTTKFSVGDIIANKDKTWVGRVIEYKDYGYGDICYDIHWARGGDNNIVYADRIIEREFEVIDTVVAKVLF